MRCAPVDQGARQVCALGVDALDHAAPVLVLRLGVAEPRLLVHERLEYALGPAPLRRLDFWCIYAPQAVALGADGERVAVDDVCCDDL